MPYEMDRWSWFEQNRFLEPLELHSFEPVDEEALEDWTIELDQRTDAAKLEAENNS